MFRKSMVLLAWAGAVLFVLSEVFAEPLTRIFISYDEALTAMTVRGFRIYAISFLRTLVFQIIVVMTLPLILGLDGIWLSIAAPRQKDLPRIRCRRPEPSRDRPDRPASC